MNKTRQQPLVFHIRHFALDDGPGIRTTVFFKGCPLSCVWCHNPESVDDGVRLAFDPRNCVDCGECKALCPRDAISWPRTPRIIDSRCDACLICARACPARAIRPVGRYYPPGEMVDLLMEDRVFYQTSGGGVTFSGGEPTRHMDYLSDVAARLNRHGIHLALQTCGIFDIQEFIGKLMPFIDVLYFDLKLMSPHAHRKYTGKSNGRILRNFRILQQESGIEIVATIPLVPGMTATEENLRQIAEFIKSTGCRDYALRPYNPGGREKRMAMGQAPLTGVPDLPMSAAALANIDALFQSVMGQPPPESIDPAQISRQHHRHCRRSVTK